MNAAVLFSAFINAIPSIFGFLATIAIWILAPLACFRRTRGAAAGGFMILTPFLGFLLWVSCAISVYGYWGLTGLVIATFVVGIGVIPAAIIAEFLDGTWNEVFGLLLMIATTIAIGIAAVSLDTEKRDELGFPE